MISFVIPCYKSQDTIGAVVSDIENVMMEQGSLDYEIVLVNDNSPDGTFAKIEELTRENHRITGIDLAKNMGQQNAIMAGLAHVKGDLVTCCDDDGQTPVEDVFLLKQKIDEGYDVACAKYTNRGKRSLFRRIGTAMNRKMSEVLLERPKDIFPSIFFVAHRFVVDEIVRYENPYPYFSGLLLRTTKNIANVELEQKNRLSGESGYTFRKLLSLWINGFTTFSVKPLRLATIVGIFFFLISILIIIFLVIQRITNPHIFIGWTSIIATNLLIGGIIMVILGMIGEYVGRIYLSINKSPQYTIRRIVKGESREP